MKIIVYNTIKGRIYFADGLKQEDGFWAATLDVISDQQHRCGSIIAALVRQPGGIQLPESDLSRMHTISECVPILIGAPQSPNPEET